MGFFKTTKKQTTNTQNVSTVQNVSAGPGDGQEILALSDVTNSTINVTDGGALATAGAIAERALDLGDGALDSVMAAQESIARTASDSVSRALQLATDRSQSEGSQQSESLIRLAMFGTAALAAVFIFKGLFK